MPIAVASRTREHGRWWETLSSPKLACARPRPGVIGTRTARHRPANRSMASTCVSAAPGWLVRPPARALQSASPGASRAAGRQVSKGRALGERSRRACDGVGVRRRWHGGVSKRRGARLEKFQEDAARPVAAMAIVAGVAASPASATVPTKGFDTQEANVPYLAWRGEHVRLGFCDYDFSISTEQRSQLGARGLERRSGQRFGPGSAGDVRLASFLQWLRVHGLRIAEGRRRLHQARSSPVRTA